MKDTPITADLVRELCARGEGTRLDFKRHPAYGDWKTKGKLDFLKDLISLANSIPAGDARAYLLLGVSEDGPEHRGKVTGFQPEPHISDAGLHEVCVGTLSAIPSFRYQQVEVDGHLVGVVEISSGDRPYFARNDGSEKLRRNIAYYREGSRNTEATPRQVVEWAREDGGLRLHAVQAESIELSMTPDPRISVSGRSKSGKKWTWPIHVHNPGESAFDIKDYRVHWYGTPALKDYLGKLGVVNPEADGLLATVPMMEGRPPISFLSGQGNQLSSPITVELDDLLRLGRVPKDTNLASPHPLFRGVVEVTAVHRSGRKRTATLNLEWL